MSKCYEQLKNVFLNAEKNYVRNQRKARQPYVEERKTLQWPSEERQNNPLHITAQKTKDLKQDLIFSFIKIRNKIPIHDPSHDDVHIDRIIVTVVMKKYYCCHKLNK